MGITPGLITRNYELGLTTVLAGVSAGVGEIEGGKRILNIQDYDNKQ